MGSGWGQDGSWMGLGWVTVLRLTSQACPATRTPSDFGSLPTCRVCFIRVSVARGKAWMLFFYFAHLTGVAFLSPTQHSLCHRRHCYQGVPNSKPQGALTHVTSGPALDISLINALRRLSLVRFLQVSTGSEMAGAECPKGRPQCLVR